MPFQSDARLAAVQIETVSWELQMRQFTLLILSAFIVSLAACGGTTGSGPGTDAGADSTSGDTGGSDDTKAPEDTGVKDTGTADTVTGDADSTSLDTDATPEDTHQDDATDTGTLPDGSDSIMSPDVTSQMDGSDGSVDTVEPPPSSLPEAPNSELLIKIIGPPSQESGSLHVAVLSAVTPVAGIVFGDPDKIEWSTSNGDTGPAKGYPFWLTAGIPLTPGPNEVTVTATKGEITVTDKVIITYNPLFLFDAKPTVFPDTAFVNEPTAALITIPITLYKSFDPNTVKVIYVDEGGVPIPGTPSTKLVDNGNLSKCDEIDQDGRFSACLKNFKCTSPKDIWLAVTVAIKSDFASYTAQSAPIKIECANRLQVSDCTSAFQTSKDARSQWEQAGGAASPGAARDATIAWLKTQANVEDAGPASGDGHGVWIRYTAGFLGALNLTPENFRGGMGMAPLQTVATAAAGSPNPWNVVNIDSKKALVLAPFNNEFTGAGGDEANDIGGLLQGSSCPNFNVDGPVTGNDVSLALLRTQYLYGIVAITSHGDAYFYDLPKEKKEAYDWDHKGSQEVLWSGEAVKCNQLLSNPKTCKATLQQGQSVVIDPCPTGTQCVFTGGTAGTVTGTCVDHTQMDLIKGRVVLSDTNWGITAPFVSRYAKRRFPKSMVYLGGCRTIYNGTFASEYFASGAKSIAGYADYTHNDYAYASGKTFFENMVTGGSQTGSAVIGIEAEDPNSPGNRFRLFGADNLDIMNAEIINDSFETGDLTGWSSSGDGRVISKLGITIPVHGKFMGIISTGLGFTVQTGEVYQSFCIPGDKSGMVFYWKFFSEEFKEWCGSQYQDTFQATLTNDQGKLTLVNAKIDDLCYYTDGSCAACPNPGVGNCECGSQYVGLIASDVSFDQGGVYNIQWQTVKQDITPFAGTGPVELKFFSSDAGDSIYDTVILFDSVEFK